tara:strand:+ start:493 stop:633 length:141 start_codon:yes stop_codon:yes gene_type:complete
MKLRQNPNVFQYSIVITIEQLVTRLEIVKPSKISSKEEYKKRRKKK